MSALLRDNNHVRMGLHCAFKDKVGGVSSHKTNEIPILNGGGTVREHVTYQLRIDLRGSIKTNGSTDKTMSNVTIDSGRHNHY
jgi:hypothetical protein